MKKFIGILVAALMIIQSVGVFAANSVYVDGNLQVRTGENDYSDGPIDAKIGEEIDYFATLDMSNVREAYKSYYETAYANFDKLGLAADIEGATVTGEFEITVNFPEKMTIPQSFLVAGQLTGFSENVKGIFTEESRTESNNVVTIAIKTSVNAKELYDNVDTYLPDFTLSCDGVKADEVGSYTVSGGLVGSTTTTVNEKSLKVDIQSREKGTDSDVISADVAVIDDSVVKFNVSVVADENVEAIVLVNTVTNEEITLEKSEKGFIGTVPVGVYEIKAIVSEDTVVDYVKSDLGVVVNSDATAVVETTEKPEQTIEYTIDTQPTNLTYTEGKDIDLSGLVIDVNGAKVSYDENPDAFTAKISPDGETITVIYENVPVKTDKIGYVTNEIRATIAKPVANATVVTTATPGAGARYTLSDVTWSPSVSDKYAYSTAYTVTITATATGDSSFTEAPAVYVNNEAATLVSVSEDGKTATLSFVFAKTSSRPSVSNGGGSSGGSSFNTGATPTPDPNATATPGATGAPTEGWFVDVATSDWFYDAIRFVYDAGLMKGTSDTTFEPNLDITRGMFITVLYRIEQEPDVTVEHTFADVASGEYYADAVAWGSANGIILGYSDTEFAPNQVIIREQIAAMMARYATYKGIDVTGAPAAEYADAASISEYAVPFVNFCTSVGLMTGVGDNNFAPQDNTTRAEVATVIMRLSQQMAAAQSVIAE